MRLYENIIIVNPDYNAEEEEILNRVKGNIEKLGGKIIRCDDWSVRKLAYAIKKKDKGHYFYLVFEIDNQGIPTLERFYRTYEPILRHTIVRIDKKRRPAEKPPEHVTFDELEGEYL